VPISGRFIAQSWPCSWPKPPAGAVRVSVGGPRVSAPSAAAPQYVPPARGALTPGQPVLPRRAPSVQHVRPLQAVSFLPFLPSRGPPALKAPLAAALCVVAKAPIQAPQARATVTPPTFGAEELAPWLEAAEAFEMNADFDIEPHIGREGLHLAELMVIMKEQSAGKATIKALADKLMLHRLLANLDVPQLPALLAIEGHVDRRSVRRFVREQLCGPNCGDVVLKPTHHSNATGVLLVSTPEESEVTSCIDYMVQHMELFMEQRAGEHESAALRSLKPGFIAQPKYQSVIGFKSPLELRVVVLWGKARVAVWWWGRNPSQNEMPRRNAWLVRKQAKRGVLSEDDEWEAVHQHTGENPGFNRALELFTENMSAIAATAEAIATAVGAPFLRTDFFVGSPEWGIRLNEVAYGCGCDYRALVDGGRLVDDAPAIAQILQQGIKRCQTRHPPQHFLARLRRVV